ncbi:flagellar biosynthetic protein FliO [uncultured Rubinisphaera sp.]|uniref:FliO/MopB family protein n=1 Tax=uncultured Rubinisphaera sp. TaxID=1678686 RepID=UPI0030D80C5E
MLLSGNLYGQTESKLTVALSLLPGQFALRFVPQLLLLTVSLGPSVVADEFPAGKTNTSEVWAQQSTESPYFTSPSAQPQQPNAVRNYSPSINLPESFQSPGSSEYSQSHDPKSENSHQATPVNSVPTETSPEDSGVDPIPLKKATGRFALNEDGTKASLSGQSSLSKILTPILALAGVISVIFVLSKVVKKQVPFAAQKLDAEVLDILGRKVVDQRHSIIFVKAGQRILVLGSSLDGLNTLAEITDPVEVDQIRGLCKTAGPQTDMTSSFKMLLSGGLKNSEKVNLDRQHRERQKQQRRQPLTSEPISFSFNEARKASSISAEDIADLEKTLEAAREGRL